jgi:hypothetical protein
MKMWLNFFGVTKPAKPRKPLVEEVVNTPSCHVEYSICSTGRRASIGVFRRARELGFRANGVENRNHPVEAIKEFSNDLGAIDRVLLALSHMERVARTEEK